MATAVCIVQARMASTRLPNKVMKRLGERSVLAHVLERCHSIAGIDKVCCATTEGSDCDAIAIEAKKCGAHVFRGDEFDVLRRYYDAAKILQADVVMRITSDCPLIDPSIAASVLTAVTAGQVDYACNNIPPSWPHGLDCEAFSFAWLERAHVEAARPSEREHMTLFIRGHKEAKQKNIPSPNVALAENRWTLDTLADWYFFKALFRYYISRPETWGYRSVLDVIETHPEIAALNAGHDRFQTLREALAADAAQGYSSGDN